MPMHQNGKKKERKKKEKKIDRALGPRRKKSKGENREMESKHSPEIPDTEADIRHPRPPFGGLAEGRRQTSTEKHKERAPK